MKRYRWNLPPVDDAALTSFACSIKASLPLARIFFMRGVKSYEAAEAFFTASLETLPSPSLFASMPTAVGRVQEAIRSGEKIMIYGDYDVDGITGTAMLNLFLRDRDADVSYYINNRFEEGYGLSMEGIRAAAERQVGLIITVDCGISANLAIERAGELGMDVIVCDHHEPEELPDAYAILNPKVPGCSYPFRELCGCGVAFRFIQAIAEELQLSAESWQQYLDLVAIATAADMVVLSEENRTMVREGFRKMQQRPRVGIEAMLSFMKVNPRDLSMTGVTFGIAPRINAAGRMGSARKAVDWLLAESKDEARVHTGELEELNILRRRTDLEMLKRAEEMVEGHFASYCSSIVLYDESWHLGVVGIVASKMLERYHLPTVILGASKELVKGSVRSVPGLNIYSVLQECSDLLEQFGGHHQAAGVSMRPENLPAFRKRFDEISARVLDMDARQKELTVDTELGLGEITGNFMKALQRFSPYGVGNPEPLFLTEGLQCNGSVRLLKERHVKFMVRDASGKRLDVIAFDRKDIYDALKESSGQSFSMVYSLELHEWNGRVEPQAKVKDLSVESLHRQVL
ncbi:single-stranded-DNA-specific exonuclease RecJ [Chlorobium phaeovibrioides]|uniref:Single-stranded-DNA-specific exonuclease RecJ n=1 Tax=Chlorobium phaeovibrioides TaxID=1094 RepID=A0ABW9UPT9_CHLPH|nr:single-stranded-DNA-specific exonuclease RecJ [Chlorobium phaeovibrioides]MWV54739.1 single-stranded-DNA-specific exonuclease RecJ [Chlorobium phaeovibrioides]QEQ57315.1 single-stranded-DNA-specific exonuclease RecJ [Chlorobium phaeovibrioides]